MINNFYLTRYFISHVLATIKYNKWGDFIMDVNDEMFERAIKPRSKKYFFDPM